MRLKKCLILLTARTSDTMWRLFLNGITFAHHKMKSLDTLLKMSDIYIIKQAVLNLQTCTLFLKGTFLKDQWN